MSKPTPIESNDSFALTRLQQGVACLRITREHRLNAMNRAVLDGLISALDSLPAQGIRVLIITAQGDKAFCAGTDLHELQTMSEQARLDKSQLAREVLFRMSNSSLISIAAINGLAFGGGLELAMACTFRLAASHARFALPEIKLGLLPAYGGTQFLPALIGHDRALDLMLTGRHIDAAQAYSVGLISRDALPEQTVFEQAVSFAEEIVCHSQPAIDGIRQAVRVASDQVTEAGLGTEDDIVRQVFPGADAREGVQAFLEKRAPVFKHGRD